MSIEKEESKKEVDDKGKDPKPKDALPPGVDKELAQKIFEMGFDYVCLPILDIYLKLIQDPAVNALSWTNNHFQSAVTMLIDNPDKCSSPKPAAVIQVEKRMFGPNRPNMRPTLMNTYSQNVIIPVRV